MAARTQAEVVARVESAFEAGQIWRVDPMLTALDYDHAAPFTFLERQDWSGPGSPEDLDAVAHGFLIIAVGRITRHRITTIQRAIDQLRDCLWLLGRDDALELMDAAPADVLSVPKLRAVAAVMGWPWPADAGLARMADGLPCIEGCPDGCLASSDDRVEQPA